MSQKNITIIGIDPGLYGAIAIMWEENINQKMGKPDISLIDTPIIEVIKSGKTKKGNRKKAKEYLENSIAAHLEYFYKAPQRCHVFLEKVGAHPGEGVVSSFTFGMGYGLWKGIIAAYHLPCTLVPPQRWKKEMMEGVSDKEASLVRAQQLFPNMSDQICKKKHIGRSDALLICEYGRRTLQI